MGDRQDSTSARDALTTECPLVLVLEDLHWSDRATLDRYAPRSKPIATAASASCMLRPASASRPTLHSPPPLPFTVPWTWPSGSPKPRQRWGSWRDGDMGKAAQASTAVPQAGAPRPRLQGPRCL